ncbi:PREDICTED: signal transducer CD24-like [Odobenus rosmarus divergens]|uniref:Signal transducer CD24-like n=1 Tax=Odobenus rosmarus divergens TaxID=9708 RepID=A0A9B0LF49_ODORO
MGKAGRATDHNTNLTPSEGEGKTGQQFSTHLGIQGGVPYTSTNGADLGRVMVARLGWGLLLLVLLLPTQIYSNQTTVVTLSSNSSQNTWTAPNPVNTTTWATGGTLWSTARLFLISFSLLHLYS